VKRSVLLATVVLLSALPAEAQVAPGASASVAPSTPRPLAGARTIARADALFGEGRLLASLEVLEAYLRGRPADYEARWKAARSAVVLGIMASSEPEKEHWLERSVRHADEAVERTPEGQDGLYWSVASKGWLAMTVDNPIRTADLADEVLSGARRLLDREPEHAGAHHALGKLHYEVLNLSRIERFLARHLLGVDVLDFASWDVSIRHLERAVALEPDMLIYRLDLAMSYERSGRSDDAVHALRSVLTLPSLHPPDPLFKGRAEALLRVLEADESQAHLPPSPVPRSP
jgi:tetratricopeptide (TPR) repeat protein